MNRDPNMKEEKDLQPDAVNWTGRKEQSAEHPPAGAPKKRSLLNALTDEALSKGRPVLVIPLDAADPQADQPAGENDEPTHELRLPKNTTVIFAGEQGFPATPAMSGVRHVQGDLGEDVARRPSPPDTRPRRRSTDRNPFPSRRALEPSIRRGSRDQHARPTKPSTRRPPMSAASLKERAVQRRVLIAAGIWAAIPAAVVAVCILISLLASAGLLPEVLPPLVVLTVLLLTTLWILIPLRTPQIPPQRYFERYSVSEGEKKVGLFFLIAVFVTFAAIWHSGLFGIFR